LLDTELNRDLKKIPVVEYYVPKSIFLDEDGSEGQFGGLLREVMAREEA
jgi:hypothetical protein